MKDYTRMEEMHVVTHSAVAPSVACFSFQVRGSGVAPGTVRSANRSEKRAEERPATERLHNREDIKDSGRM